jgi:hypothetical protein
MCVAGRSGGSFQQYFYNRYKIVVYTGLRSDCIMLPDTGIDDVKKQRNAEYAKHINDPVLSSLKMEGVRLLFLKWSLPLPLWVLL